jgi:hypothetical protein
MSYNPMGLNGLLQYTFNFYNVTCEAFVYFSESNDWDSNGFSTMTASVRCRHWSGRQRGVLRNVSECLCKFSFTFVTLKNDWICPKFLINFLIRMCDEYPTCGETSCFVRTDKRPNGQLDKNDEASNCLSQFLRTRFSNSSGQWLNSNPWLPAC